MAMLGTHSGDPVSLPAKLATPMALLFHELATNACKYGAFSAGAGVLQVSWNIEKNARDLKIVWDEAGGPTLKSGTKEGFGLKLINSVLSSFNGKADLQFLETGLHCTIKCKIPEA